MQCFHWYTPASGALWSELSIEVEHLAAAGFTALWLPPAYKGIHGPWDAGYGVYDLYDLGEFEQKGTVPTKYGTKAEYLGAIQAAQGQGLQVYGDAVLNHRIGGDALEAVKAAPFSQHDRLHPQGDLEEISAYTHFYFPGRRGQYSTFEWHWHHFDAVDYNHRRPEETGTIYRLEGKTFDDYEALDRGSFAYLMGCDVDYQSQAVRDEITRWGQWYMETTGLDGLRLDAVKHIASWFFPEWIEALEAHVGRELFIAGEYWVPNLDSLLWYVDALADRVIVLDVCLHYNFHYASHACGHYDLRRIFDGTLVKHRPTHAITFVENQDSQPLRALESAVAPWFKPLAYALILLRAEGYPCVFAPDYYGADYEDTGYDGQHHAVQLPAHRWLLDCFLEVRRSYAYGEQYDYFDHPNTVGWTRLGDAAHPGGMAVLMSDGDAGHKWMNVGQPLAEFVDVTEHVGEPVRTNADGWGEFFCRGSSVSVWVLR